METWLALQWSRFYILPLLFNYDVEFMFLKKAPQSVMSYIVHCSEKCEHPLKQPHTK